MGESWRPQPCIYGRHMWRLEAAGASPYIAWCARCGLRLVEGEEAGLPRKLRGELRQRKTALAEGARAVA